MGFETFVLSIPTLLTKVHCVLPDSDIAVFSTRIHLSRRSIENNIMDRPFVSYKLEWPELRLEAPDVNDPIGTSTDNLLP